MAAKPLKTEISNRDLISHEFIPYACHYAPDTILTKNGELIQFIRISDSGGDNDHEFRENLRNAINNTVDATRVSVWIHTIRSKSEIKSFDEGDYAQYLDYLWRLHLPSEIHFTNEIYISIIIDSTQFDPWKLKSFMRSLSTKKERDYRAAQLDEKFNTLSRISDEIVQRLSLYEAEKLAIYENNDNYYSEIMEFARTLMGVNYSRMSLPLTDISYKLKPNHLDFDTYTGVVTIEDPETNTKKFGAVISIKENIGITAPALQELLNANAEFIITQAVDFAYGNRYLPAIRDQIYFNSISMDKNFLESSEMEKLKIDKPDSFVLQQTNLTIIKSTEPELHDSMSVVQKNLQQLGLVAYLEDINSERTYWSNVSGNFAFLKRQDTMPRTMIGNFACFGVDKYTSVEDCLFGKPIMFFQTQDLDIFALHFLSNGQGHILAVGGTEDDRHVFAGMIAAESSFAGAQVIYYDHTGKYKNFADAIEAEYHTELNLDLFAQRMEGDHVKIMIFSTIKPILDGDAHKVFQKFLEYAGEHSCVVIVCESLENNCELLLADFTTTTFFPCTKVLEEYADNYDIFEDERIVIEALPAEFIYARHGYEEMTLKFNPSEKLRKALLEGSM